MTHILTLAALLVAAVILFFAYTRWIPLYYARRDIVVHEPALKRSDLKFGYYGSLRDQVAETRDHVNLFWPFQFEGTEKLIADIRAAALPTVLDVGLQLTERNRGGKSVLREHGEARLREFLIRLELEGVLHHVIGLTVGDEPNSQFESLLEWTRANDTLRLVLREFPSLSGVKVVTLLNGAAPMDLWVPHADLVGFDCYSRRASIFQTASWWPPKWDGEYTRLRKMLRPDQRTFLVPGGGKARDVYEQDPTPFINAAHTFPEVWAVVPFLWPSTADGDNHITGIRDIPAMRDAYTAAGRKIVGAA